MIKYLPTNEIGEDYVCGDLHGHRQILMEKLDHLGFDFGKDRLFCTGDLNDRGPDSFGTLGLVFEPWFHFVRGNHEEDLPGFIKYGSVWGDGTTVEITLRQKCTLELFGEFATVHDADRLEAGNQPSKG